MICCHVLGLLSPLSKGGHSCDPDGEGYGRANHQRRAREVRPTRAPTRLDRPSATLRMPTFVVGEGHPKIPLSFCGVNLRAELAVEEHDGLALVTLAWCAAGVCHGLGIAAVVRCRPSFACSAQDHDGVWEAFFKHGCYVITLFNPSVHAWGQ